MRILLLYSCLFICSLFQAQTGLFINGPDASLRVDSTSFISVNGDLQNLKCDPKRQVRFNGPLYLSGSLVNNDILKFTATTGPGNSKRARIIFMYLPAYPSGLNAGISGTVTPELWEVEIDKSASGSLTLNNNVNCADTANFKTGLVYMNGYKWTLKDPIGAAIVNHPYLKSERHSCQFMPSSINDTGLVILKTIYNYSLDIDPANIGITITGPVNLGSKFTVFRGFKPQINAGKSSILRYFELHSPGHALGANFIKVNYVYNDFGFFNPGYFNLPLMKLFASSGGDLNWSPLPSTVQNTLVNLSTQNGMLSAQLSDLSLPNIGVSDTLFRITIADADCPNLPVSGLLLDTLHICTGNTVTLDAGNNSPVPNSSLRWEWNTLPKRYTQTHTVTSNNTFQKYIVKLMDARGCQTIDSVVIAPQAPFPQIAYFNHMNSCLGDSISIKDTVKISSGSYSNSWLFSDGQTSSTSQPLFKKKFSLAGEHAIQLTSTSNYGCSVTVTSTNVVVYPPPTAGFTNSLDCSNGLVTFKNTSVSNHTALVVSSSLWNLGQGQANTSTLISPSQTYSSSGTYTVKLMSTSSFGCKDSVSNLITIYPANLALFTKNNSCLSDTVFFNNTSACNTGNCSYSWSFGDASQSSLISPKKVYAAPGLYVIKLKVTDPLGCPDSLSTNVFVNHKPNPAFTATTSNICINNFIYFTNTSSILTGSISGYSWNMGNGFTNTSTNAAANYTTSGIFTVTLTALSDSGCVNNYIQSFTIHPQPLVQYTVNNACLGSPSQFVSSSVGAGLSYIWDYGNTVITNSTNVGLQQYTYPSIGTYSTQLIATDSWGCSDTSSALTTVFASPAAALGGSISTCGTAYTLNAGNPGSSYLWHPGNQTTQTIQATSSGFYQVSITNTNTCSGTETVQVTLNSVVKPDLGNDSTVCGSFDLDAGYPGSTYLWNTSATSQTITASITNTYIVQVTDANGCIGVDTIDLVVNIPASVYLGNNLTYCKSKYGTVLSSTTNAISFLWSTGATTSTLNISSSGNYWLEGVAANGCKAWDTIHVSLLNTPQINLGPDRFVCGSAFLDAQNIGCLYLWNTGDTGQTLDVNASGNYWVTVTNTTNACSQLDTINITVNPLVNVFLGNDTTLCSNAGFFLSAQNSGSNYNWTSGQTTQGIPVTSSGIYGVTVTNSGGCSKSDYISITLVNAPVADLGPGTRYLCGNNSVELGLPTTAQVTWASESGLSASGNLLSIRDPGKYWAKVSAFGCHASDTVLVVATNNTIQALFLASTQDTVNKPVKFINLSVPPPVSQLWSFGDGVTSTEFSPLHTFVLPQDFSVTLEVSNGFCTDKITKALSVLFRQAAPQIYQPVSRLELLAFRAYPNPACSYLQIDVELNDNVPVELSIFDITGRLILKEDPKTGMSYSNRISTEGFKNGLYILTMNAHSPKGNIIKTAKLIKTN